MAENKIYISKYKISEMKLKLMYEINNAYLDHVDYSFSDFVKEFDIEFITDETEL